LTEQTAKESFYEKLMQYFTQYPESGPTSAVKYALNQLGGRIPQGRQWDKLVHEADTVKGRARAKLARDGKLNSPQLDRPAVIRGVGGGVSRLDNHYPHFGPEPVPDWLAGAVGGAAIAGFGGWRVARRSMFQWNPGGERCSAQCYAKKKTLRLFPGSRRYDLEKLRHFVFSNLILVLDGFGPEDREVPARLEFYAGEISRFLGLLFEGPDGFHLAAKKDDLRGVAPCQFEFPPGMGLRRVRINDGSHSGGWIEFEFEGLRKTEREVRGLRADLATGLQSAVAAAGKDSDLARGVQELKGILPELNTTLRSFVDDIREATEAGKKPRPLTTAEERRYS